MRVYARTRRGTRVSFSLGELLVLGLLGAPLIAAFLLLQATGAAIVALIQATSRAQRRRAAARRATRAA